MALQRDGAPVSITQIMPRTINTRCPTTLAPRWRRSVPKNSDLGIGRPPRGQPGVGVGAPLAAVLTAWLHHLTATAHDGRLIGHGIRAGPGMITTLRWRLLAVPGPPDPSRPPDHPAPTAPRRPARPRSSPCLNRPDQAERPPTQPRNPLTRSEHSGRLRCPTPGLRPDQHQLFRPSLA